MDRAGAPRRRGGGPPHRQPLLPGLGLLRGRRGLREGAPGDRPPVGGDGQAVRGPNPIRGDGALRRTQDAEGLLRGQGRPSHRARAGRPRLLRRGDRGHRTPGPEKHNDRPGHHQGQGEAAEEAGEAQVEGRPQGVRGSQPEGRRIHPHCEAGGHREEEPGGGLRVQPPNLPDSRAPEGASGRLRVHHKAEPRGAARRQPGGRPRGTGVAGELALQDQGHQVFVAESIGQVVPASLLQPPLLLEAAALIDLYSTIIIHQNL